MLNDLRYALRTLRRSPAFTISAVLALALGVGANTAVFSVVYAVLLKPPPFFEPDRLVVVSELNTAEGRDDQRVSRGTYADWRARVHTVESLAAYSSIGDTLWGAGDRYTVVRSAAVSSDLFPLLRVTPLLGRALRADDERKIIISHELWQRSFGGAPDVVGRAITVEGRFAGEIIGVAPRGFSFPEGAEAWANLRIGAPVPGADRRTLSYHALARLAPGVSLEDARQELQNLSAQLAIEQPSSNRGWTAQMVPLAGSDTAAARPALLALLAAVGGVLLIGCANVANLLLARASARDRDTAVRIALGAGMTRLARQALIDSAVLAACGTVTGLAVGYWITGILVRLSPPDVPRLAHVRMTGTLLMFAAAVGLISAAFIAFAPAVQITRAARSGALRPDMRAATPRAALARRLLIGGEVAAVIVLLTGALLFLRTFVSLRGVELGFHAEHVWNVSARWPLARMIPTAPGTRPWPRIQRAVDGLIAAVDGIPGVEATGLISDVPLTGDPYSGTVWPKDAPGAAGLTPPTDPAFRWKADLSVVTPGYFRALGVPVLRGRNFIDSDRWTDVQLNASTAPATGVVVVNNTFAARYFAGQDPVGRTLVLADDQTFGWSRTIVGVVGDVRGRAVADAAAPAVFVPHAQHPDVFLPSLLVRSRLPPDALTAAIRQRIGAYDPQLLVQRIRPMDDIVSGALSRPRFNLVLVGSFAILGLTLAAVGIYGVVSLLVTQRTREIGIRMALGARARDVLSLVLREGMVPVLLGGVAGVALALLMARAITTLLFGVTPVDPVSLAAAPAILAAVALIACYIPARRATRIDPLVALRND